MKHIFLIFTFSVLAVSCDNNPYDREIAEIDVLMQRLDTAKTTLASIDTVEIIETKGTFGKKFAFIEQVYSQNADTIGKELAMLLADYRELKKPYGQFMPKMEATRKELAYTEKQLITLRHDLENNLLDTNVVVNLWQTEKDAAEKVLAEVLMLKAGRRNLLEKKEAIEPKIDSIITVMKNK